jgi:prophage tail gpP-like protein
MRDDRVELLIAGQLYAGWTKVGVTRAMDAAAGTFNLSVTDRWSPNERPWPITPGDACEVRIGGETVISGYVDLVRPSFSASSHTIEVQGRDKSADLVDCSAVHDPDEWRGIDLLRLAQILGAPFGVSARAETSVGAAFDLVKLQHGETALEALVRHAKMRKVLVMPDARGGILLTRTGSRRAGVELVQGANLLDADGTLDGSERFSQYIVKGQAGFSEDTDGEVEAHASASATDAGVTRYRPLLIVADTGASDATAQERATWEANTRLGRSAEASVTVQGWRQTANGALWEPNLLVRARAPWLRLDGEMLVRQVTFSKSGSGTTTKLDLVTPQAYEPEPPDGKQKKKAKGGNNPWLSSIGEEVRNG